MKQVTDYEVIDLGIEYSDYFQGFGTSFAPYTESVVGIGNSLSEALEDALDQIASIGHLIETVLDDEGLEDYEIDLDDYDEETGGDTPWVYIGIHYNIG